ncbi:hypothetical protein [Catellatospora sp. TT07R-123]|uniref:hypothetical protein n=1 Tax=Catellatospora sp. TT07R-123 TaxID=2733863 RepID=UPI001BB2F5D8|nr:hypothetical protein [Catellatospora sp. TT07R-123]
MIGALSLLDIAAYRAQRALGSVVLAQVTWLVDGPPDPDRLRALADHLAAANQTGRVIVPASVLGGRDHWGPLPAVPAVEVEDDPIDRVDVLDWVDERAQVPITATARPWHLAARPLTGGGHAVTLVVSHALTDGIGLVNALTSLGLPGPGPRTVRRPGPLTGLQEAVTGLPSAVRAAVKAARLARGGGPAPTASPTTSRTRPHTALALIDSAAWHAAAAAQLGSSNALFVSVAAQVAAAIGRVATDGTALLGIPVNERADGDDVTANALATVRLNLPADRIRDVAHVRAELKRILSSREPDASFAAALPLVPYLPSAALRPLAQAALGGAEPVTSASHVGVVPRSLADAPGPAGAVFMNLGMQHPGVTETAERLNCVAVEASGMVALHVGAVADRLTDRAEVRSALLAALRAVGAEPRELL